MAFTPADRLAAARQSLLAAGARDREGWVGLFADGGRVEDPVGSRPHRGAGQIGRFYDTFIGPRQITFHPALDIVAGATVIRDLELDVAMGAVTMRIPAYLRYVLTPGLRIAELQAYWELPGMVVQYLRAGFAALPAGLPWGGQTGKAAVHRAARRAVCGQRGRGPPQAVPRHRRVRRRGRAARGITADRTVCRRTLGQASCVGLQLGGRAGNRAGPGGADRGSDAETARGQSVAVLRCMSRNGSLVRPGCTAARG